MRANDPGPGGTTTADVTRADVTAAEDADEEALTLVEVADRLGVHYMTAYRYVRTGLLPATQRGGQWRVPVATFEGFRSEREGQGPRSGRRAHHPVAASAPPVGSPKRARSLADRLVVGDEAGAWRIVESALAAGWPAIEVYLHLLTPALARIGDRWEAGEITVAAEHQASVVVMRIIGRLGARSARPGRTRGSVILAAAPGDRHGLPTAILSDLLRADGLRVTDLGADTPAEQIAAAAEAEDRLLAVGICATTTLDQEAEHQLRHAIHLVRAQAHCAVLVGGAAISSAALAERLGADHWSREARQALTWFDQIAVSRRRPTSTRPTSTRAGSTRAGSTRAGSTRAGSTPGGS